MKDNARRQTHETKIAMILSASSKTNSSCKERHLIKGPYGSSDFASDCCERLWNSGRLVGSAKPWADINSISTGLNSVLTCEHV